MPDSGEQLLGTTRTGGSRSGKPADTPEEPKGETADGAGVRREGPVVRLPLSALTVTESPCRDGVDDEHVRILARSTDLPPIVVHRASMRVVDGVHRVRAAQLSGALDIEAVFFDGTADDAFVLALRRNVEHGLLLTKQERKAAARRLFALHPDWSNRAVAHAAGLSEKTVAALRPRATQEIPQSHVRVGIDGRVRPLNGGAGRRRAVSYLRDNPHASLREIASAAGISPGTARDVRDRLRRGEDPVPPKQRSAEGGGRGGESRAARPHPAGESPSDVSALTERARRDALARLYKDPSLRHTETGRLLLRLLDNRLLGPPEWERIGKTLPPHSLHTVCAAIHQCIETWSQMATHLSKSQDEPVSAAF